MKNAKHDMISLVHMANPMTNTGTDTMRIKVVGIGATMRMRNTMMRKRTTMKKTRVMNMKMILMTMIIMNMRTSQTKMTRRIISLMTATGKKRKTVHIGSEGWSSRRRKKRRR